MSKLTFRPVRGVRVPIAQAFAVAFCQCAAAAAFAADLPNFRHGLWEFNRTVNGQHIASRNCGSPTDQMRAQNAKLESSGCKISALDKAGNTYTSSSECAIRMPGGGTLKSSSKSVLTVESDSVYRLQVTGTAAGEPTHETMVAKRVGDCAK